MKVIEIKGNSDLTVLWLHGYGANAWDLQDLSEICDPESVYTHLFPNAPIDLSGGGERGQRAWFPLDLSQLQNIGPGGGGLKLSSGRRESAQEALPVVDQLFAMHSLDPAKTILAGFSQGAILSLLWMLERKVRLRGLVLLSGAPLDEKFLEDRLPEHQGQRFFQSHGVQDDVLSYSEAERLRSLFKKNALVGTWVPFRGGHGVGEEALVGLGRALKEWQKI